jgi:hypothetical protein
VTLEHHAEVWTSEDDGCYRYITEPGTTRPMRCPHPAVWTDEHRDGNCRWQSVRCCDGHRGGLTRTRRHRAG